MQALPAPLRPLADYAQFIVWRAVWIPVKNKYDKLPVCPVTGANIDHTNPANWMSFETANALANAQGLGVGFYLTKQDPFFVVDMDGVLQPDGQWSPLAQEMCQAFGGGAVEVSYSGTGLHIFGIGPCPEDHRCRSKDAPGLEFYTHGRFMAITGTGATGNAYQDCTSGIDYLLTKYLPGRETYGGDNWTASPVPEWDGPADDGELLKKMLAAKPSAAGAFGSRATVKQLWEGDADALAHHFPSKTEDVYNRSSADAALMQHLAFWAGKDCERMQRLFEMSGLMRDKFRDREDYRIDTITSAASWCKDVYKMRRKVDKPEPAPYGHNEPVPEGVIREGYQYLGLPQQLEFFRGCVYVSSQHAIKIPNGLLLTADRFKTEYGGYVFSLDSIGDKSSKNAWEVFTESQGLRFPRAYGLCFRPELPVNEVIVESGLTKVNVYVPVETRRMQGDPSIFLNHLALMIPDATDRAYLLAYMATCVQHPGTKLRWCPFIQGVPGNGKSTICEVMIQAIGTRYTFSPKASEISAKFNSWAENKLFVAVHDVYTRDRQETIETLKPMITESTIPVEPKGMNQYMADNRFNFILNSNHKDGYLKTDDDRRTAPFFTAQQSKADLRRDGMDSTYMRRLDEWLKADGFAIMTDFLHTYPVHDAYDPRYMACAPETTSTREALEVGLGAIEQEVLEVIGQNKQGFAGGWVSSIALERLLDGKNLGRKIPQNKRKDLLAALGYIKHPGLSDGRTTSAVAIDGGTKPRLYIQAGHLSSQLHGNKAIVDAYTKAQEQTNVTDVAQQIFNKGQAQ